MPSDYLEPLHCHEEHSIKDGCASVESYAARVQELGGKSLSVSNHGQMAGAARQYFACKAAGIKPIFSLEAYVNDSRLLPLREAVAAAKRLVKRKAPGAKEKLAKLQARVQSEFRPSRHALLVARTKKGYQNLVRISTDSWLRGFYYAPRTDTKFLAEHAEGLAYSTACIGGAVPALAREDFTAGCVLARKLQAAFGPENFYVELMPNAYSKQRETNQVMLRLAKEVGARTLATGDVHYLRPDDQKAQRVLLLLRDGKTIQAQDAGEGGWQFEAKDLWFKARSDVFRSWRRYHADYWPKEDFLAAVRNVDELAASCEAWDWDLSLKLPKVFESPEARLRELVAKGFRDRSERGQLLSGRSKREYGERLCHELRVISAKAFDEYFLVLWDLMEHARKIGSRTGPGRGSAGGSLVAFVLGITEIDPLRHGLIFERFLDPSRKDAPDVDLDFSPEHRDPIKRYLEKRYPACASIGTFGTFKVKSAIQNVGATYGIARSETAKITKQLALTDEEERPLTPESALSEYPEVAAFAKANPEAWDVIRTLAGKISHRGEHAAGVMIGPAELHGIVPLLKDPKTGSVVTAFADTSVQGGGAGYEGRELSRMGILKIDVLGVSSLNVAPRALELLSRDGGTPPDLESIPLDDAAALREASSGDVPGVFQFDTPTSRRLLKLVGVSSFGDLSAITALARPGPLENGLPEKYAQYKRSGDGWKAEVPEALHEILADTRGLLVYQESVMFALQIFGGFSMSEANAVRKVIGKKLAPEVLEEWRGKFISGGTARGHDGEQLNATFDSLLAYTRYAFNAAHSVAYALTAYRQLYVLARWPAEYFAALLSTDDRKAKGGEEDILVAHVRNALARGIRVLPPSVSDGGVDFDVVRDGDSAAVRYGLSKVKGVANAAAAIVSEREANGAFSDLDDFVRRVPSRACNAAAFRALVLAGAFDDLAFDRRRLDRYLELEEEDPIVRRSAVLVRHAWLTRKAKSKKLLTPERSFPEGLRARERELLGIVLSFWGSGAPSEIRAKHGLGTIRDEVARDGKRLRLLAEVSRRHDHATARGTMSFVTLADETGRLDNLILWASQRAAFKDRIGVGKVASWVLYRKESPNDRYGKWSYHLDDRSAGDPVISLGKLKRSST